MILKDEFEISPEGIKYPVLDIQALDFTSAPWGQKISETRVRCAIPGEAVYTYNSKGKLEGEPYLCEGGEAIFQNLHDLKDQYVPANAEGQRLKFSELERHGFATVSRHEHDGSIRVVNTQKYKILTDIVDQPLCIRNVRGLGKHQFLPAGSALKLGKSGRVSGVEPTAFEKTWAIIKKPDGAKPASGPRKSRRPK